jgi:hypothetical protein
MNPFLLRTVLVGAVVLVLGGDCFAGSLHRSKVPVEDVPDSVFRCILSSKEYRENAFPTVEPDTTKGLANLRNGIFEVERFTLPDDDVSFWILRAVQQARNIEFFVVASQAHRSRVAAEFWGEDYTLSRSNKGVLVLKAWANYGGGNLTETIYHYRDGKFVEVAKHDERVNAGN